MNRDVNWLVTRKRLVVVVLHARTHIHVRTHTRTYTTHILYCTHILTMDATVTLL